VGEEKGGTVYTAKKKAKQKVKVLVREVKRNRGEGSYWGGKGGVLVRVRIGGGRTLF